MFRMFAPLTFPGRRAASAMLLLLGTSLATPALPQGAKARRAAAAHAASTTPPVAPAPAELRDGQAEARLMAVYKLVAEGRGREALAQAESLARDYPNFQLDRKSVV